MNPITDYFLFICCPILEDWVNALNLIIDVIIYMLWLFWLFEEGF